MDIDIEEDKIEIEHSDLKLKIQGKVNEKWLLIAVSLIISIFGLEKYFM